MLDPETEVFALDSSILFLRKDESLRQLRGNGVKRLLRDIQERPDPNLRVGDTLITCSYLHADLLPEIQAAMPCVLLKPGTSHIWIGPRFAAGSSPCPRCFLRRLISNDDRWAMLSNVPVTFRRGPRLSAGLRATVAAHLERLQPGMLIRVNTATGEASTHRIVPLADCTGCTIVANNTGESPQLWDTVRRRLGHLIDPLTGIVSEPSLCTSAFEEPVYVAIARYADPSGKLGEYEFDGKAKCVVRSKAVSRTAFGGGVAPDDACARAVLEAIERYSGIYQGDQPTRVASLAELGEQAIHPNRLMNYSAGQLSRPTIRSRGTPRELVVPEAFDEEARIHWTEVESLSGTIKYVPTAWCYDGFDRLPDSCFSVYDTNGSAVSFRRDDAIRHAFLELVERDAVAIWWYNRISRPLVAIRSFDDPVIDRIAARHDELGRRLLVFDLTHDFELPVFAAVSILQDTVPQFGFGAHFDARSALTSALMELEQARRVGGTDRWGAIDWKSQTQLFPSTERREAGDYEEWTGGRDIQWCADRAAAVGLELFIRDCTRADTGLSAVRVIMPGIRHIWPRFGPGRLMDVPVALRWRNEPTPPEEINPVYLRS